MSVHRGWMVVLSLGIALVAQMALSASAFGQLSLRSWSVDGGGDTMSGGGLQARCALGEEVSGVNMSGGGFTVIAGFYNPGTTTVVTPKPCPADVNRDGLLTPDDLADFITAYFGDAEGIVVDINGDGFVEPGDFDEFVTIFFNIGC